MSGKLPIELGLQILSCLNASYVCCLASDPQIMGVLRAGGYPTDLPPDINILAAAGELKSIVWVFKHSASNWNAGMISEAMRLAVGGNHSAVVELFLKCGTDNAPVLQGLCKILRLMSPEMVAKDHQEMVQLLWEHEILSIEEFCQLVDGHDHGVCPRVVNWLATLTINDILAARFSLEQIQLKVSAGELNLSNSLFRNVVDCGNFGVARWCIQIQPFDEFYERAIQQAAKRDRLEFLQWMFGAGHLHPIVAARAATKAGHLRILRWLDELEPRNRDYIPVVVTSDTMLLAAREGHLPIVKWIYHLLPFTDKVCHADLFRMVIYSQHLELTKWVFEEFRQGAVVSDTPQNSGKPLKVPGTTFTCIVEQGCLELLVWIVETWRSGRLRIPKRSLHARTNKSNFATFAWLYSNVSESEMSDWLPAL